MKNFFKFTTAAAALVALASCSNEDLFEGQKSATVAYEQGDLIVNVEQVKGEVTTRAISNEDMSVVNWEKSDFIKVYDGELHKWDRYGFNGSKFVIEGEQDLTNAQYALYPFGFDGPSGIGSSVDGGVISTNWSKGGKTTATMEIPQVLNYKESELTDGTIAYWCALPQWGTVSSTDGKLETNLKYMTAILRIRLANVNPADVPFLRIRAFKDEALTKEIALSGQFTATLDTENPENTILGEELGSKPLYVSLTGAKASNSVVFVPIVACTNAIIVIDYITSIGSTPAADVKSTLPEAKTKKLSQKNYVRGTLYKAKGAEFSVNTGKPSDINKAIAAAKTLENPEITATIATEATESDNQIIIPEGTTAESITLNLKTINTSANILYIEDENVDNPYTGVVTVNIENNVTGANPIVAQTKAATVQFAGKDYTAAPLKAFVKELVVGNGADTDATKVNINELGAMVEAVSVKAKATVNAITAPAENALAEVLVEGTVTGAITANTNEKVATAVTVNGGTTGNILTTGAVVVADGTVDAIGSTTCYANSLTVSASDTKATTISNISYVNGNISTATVGTGTISMNAVQNKSEKTDAITLDFAGNTTVTGLNLKTSKNESTITFADKAYATGNINAPLATINLKSEKTFTGTITATYLSLNGKAKATGGITTGKLVIQGEASVVNATASNNVYVKLSKEGEAISGTLTIPAENTEGMQVALHNGYINKINLSAATKDVALKTSAAQIAIAEVTVGAGETAAKFVPAAASAWDGKTIDKTKAAFDKYRQATQIWTASQLASLDQTAQVDLMNDINLGTTDTWTMPALKDNFFGRGHTITGGKIVAKDDNGTGLFSTIVAGKVINNLTFTGATITSAGKSQVGALVGKAEGGVIIRYKVTVNATLNVTGAANNIGGLVGYAVGKAVFGKSDYEWTKDVDVTLSALAGQFYLGGLVGQCNGAEVYKTTVAITNGITFTPTKKEPALEDPNEPKAGSIGMFIGKSNENVIVGTVNPAANDQIKGKRTSLGFKRSFTGTAPTIYYYFGGQNTEVGQLATGKTLTVGTKTFTSTADLTANGAGDGTKAIDWTADAVKDKFNVFVNSKAYAATDVK